MPPTELSTESPGGQRREFWGGVRAEAPILLGVLPFGLIYGVLARKNGLSVEAALAMSSIVFAGSAQFVIAQQVGGGAPAPVIWLIACIVNVRHMLYSASVAPYLKPIRPAWRFLLAYLLTDEAYAVAIAHYWATDALPNPSPYRHWYFFGAGLTLWGSWQLSTAAGVLVGAQIPPEWGLDFTLALTFIALVVPALKDRAAVAAALSAGIVAVLANGLPYKLGLLVAALVGIAVGVLVERGHSPHPPSPSTLRGEGE